MTGSTNAQNLTQTPRSRAILLVAMAAGGLGPFVQAQAPPAAAPAAAPAPESVSLETSDQVNINIVYYPAVVQPAAPATPPPAVPVVMLLHDLNGSNESLVGLAKSRQKRGFAVVVPDLRGHGDSTTRTGIDALLEPDDLTKADFEAMVLARGGQIRAQATNRGDVEVVRGCIREKASSGVLDMKRFFVVGSGAGAAIAAAWTVEDATWRDGTSGPQGREVRGLVMVSPTQTVRGFSMASTLFAPKNPAADHVKRSVPILVIAGENESDATRLIKQLKAARPSQWYEKLASEASPTPNPKKKEDSPTTLFIFQLLTSEQGDGLATLSGPSGDVAGLIAGFMATVAPAGK